VSSELEQNHLEPKSRLIALTLAGIAVLFAGIMPAGFSRLSPEYQIWNMSIIGAIGLFASSRLGFWWGVGFLGLAICVKDASFYFTFGWLPSWFSWPCFIIYAVVGWLELRQARSFLRIGTAALTGSLLFFFVSNFLCWLDPNLGYEGSLNGLADCYIKAVPFFRGTIQGDLIFTGVLFAAHAVLVRLAYSPRTQTIAVQTKEQS